MTAVRELTVQPAREDDAALILRFIRELAQYEKAEHEVVATEEDIRRSLFGAGATAKSLICALEGEPVGFAVYFYSYSTWLGKKGLYLEDLYVTPERRHCGAGRALLKYLARLAVREGCGRMEWSVLDWNQPAIGFYESIGAEPQSEWIRYRLDGEKLSAFARDG